MLFAYEDRRFLEPPWRRSAGARPRVRRSSSTNGRIVSGASTLTMQVARLLEPRSERSFIAKLRQIVRAIQLERALSKDEILALYFSLAPYGGNLEGIRAASLAYFGKEPRRLTLAESALLVALPQSPEVAPSGSLGRRRARRARSRARSAGGGRRRAGRRDRAREAGDRCGRPPADADAGAAFGRRGGRRGARPRHPPADHRRAAAEEPRRARARTRAHARSASLSVAILVVDNETGEVHARVASADYFDMSRAGQVDMTQALRSPGSALKPFIYGLGFEDGLIHPETLIDDRPIRYGSYAPENFDLSFQGTVTVRRALQLSLNVPAVAVLDRVGASRFTARLAQAGGALVLPRGEVPGLAMGLGGVGVTLNDLVMLYAGIARLGNTIALTERMDGAGEAPAPRRLMEPVAAWYVGNVLLGTPPPENAAGGRIAFKTGTSYGYRDAWAVGFDGKRTIGVWVGRPDGAPVPGLIARSAAAPILFDAFARTGNLPARAAGRAARNARGRDRPPAAAAAAVPPERRGGRGRGRPGPDHVPAQRGAARARQWRRRPA